MCLSRRKLKDKQLKPVYEEEGGPERHVAERRRPSIKTHATFLQHNFKVQRLKILLVILILLFCKAQIKCGIGEFCSAISKTKANLTFCL